MYKYETHLHTLPVSKCAKADVRENLEFYKRAGYDGVFITNHFIDGNISCDKNAPYEQQIDFYFSDYEKAAELAAEIGIKVFCGVEMSYKGTDFLVYGLSKEWYLAHPEIMEMKTTDKLTYLAENGALVIQAHPFREARYIDHIRLFPRHVFGVEIVNGCSSDFENDMAKHYAESYGLTGFAGSDNHNAGRQPRLAGICSHTPLTDEQDFINCTRNGEMEIFVQDNPFTEKA